MTWCNIGPLPVYRFHPLEYPIQICLQPFPTTFYSQPCRNIVFHPPRFELVDVGSSGGRWEKKEGRREVVS